MRVHGIDIPDALIGEFCRKWKIVEFSLFGSILRDDFNARSDIDVLVKFAPDAAVTLLAFTTMQDQLVQMFGRPVDLVEKRGIVNPFLRHDILTTRRVLYAA